MFHRVGQNSDLITVDLISYKIIANIDVASTLATWAPHILLHSTLIVLINN